MTASVPCGSAANFVEHSRCGSSGLFSLPFSGAVIQLQDHRFPDRSAHLGSLTHQQQLCTIDDCKYCG